MRSICFILLAIYFLGCNAERTDLSIQSHVAPYDHHFYRLAPPSEEFDAGSAIRHLKTSVDSHRQKSRSSTGSWVVEGPANIGARINSVAINPHNHNHMVIGYSAGGIYVTVDGGGTWNPTFDDNEYLAIGDIEFSPHKDLEVIMGTGDVNISGYPFLGNGVFRSSDGGLSWHSIGLEEVGIVSKVAFHPSQPDVLLVSSMGLPYRRGMERGLYRSDDNGKTWTQILHLGKQTGVIDFLIDPEDGDRIYAAGWDRIRRYDESTISGDGAKIYRSDDGGTSWTTLGGGLPSAPQGRIGLALAPSNPDRIYALYVSPTSNLHGVYTSANGGESWQEVPTSDGLPSFVLGGFGWYFGKIRVHPTDEHKPYILGVNLWEFRPDSLSWELSVPSPGVHADKHDLVFLNQDTMVLATDGGLYRSPNGGQHWFDIESIATTQFYRVDYNPHRADLTWGGAQDNGIVMGKAEDILDWLRIRGADGFRCLFHPDDPLIFYTESQRGGLSVTTNGGASFHGATTGVVSTDRRNWDLPVIMSAHNPDVLYYGTQRLYRSQTGAAVNFEAISPDLTDGDVGFAPTSNITAIAESKVDASSLLVGTGDGKLSLSRDGGESWQPLSGLPDRWYTSVQFGEENQQLYVTQTGYKDGVFVPYIHRSTDDGQHWTNIGEGLPQTSVNDLLILPHNSQQVLFAATDAGVYYTIDGGISWRRLGENLPIIATFELDYNPAQNKLLAATYGKSIQSFDLVQVGLDANPTVGIQDWIANLSIYPNPADQQITVLHLADALSKFQWRAVDVTGHAIRLHAEDQRIMIDNLAPGVYILQAEARSKVWQGKFIKH